MSFLQKTALNLVKCGLHRPSYYLHPHIGGSHSVLYFTIEKYSNINVLHPHPHPHPHLHPHHWDTELCYHPSSTSKARGWSYILSGKKNTCHLELLLNFVDVKYSRNSKYCRSSLKKFWYMIWKQSKKPILHSPPIPTQFSNPHQFMPCTQLGLFWMCKVLKN